MCRRGIAKLSSSGDFPKHFINIKAKKIRLDVFRVLGAPYPLFHLGLVLFQHRRREEGGGGTWRPIIRKLPWVVMALYHLSSRSNDVARKRTRAQSRGGIGIHEFVNATLVKTLLVEFVTINVAIGGGTIYGKKEHNRIYTNFPRTVFTVAGAWDWFFLSRSKALTISLSSATSGETPGVEELVLTLETIALLRE
ncbi:hypothetical protein Tco_1376385 [Tanacetum coccineum]